jgi:hypothetical protein
VKEMFVTSHSVYVEEVHDIAAGVVTDGGKYAKSFEIILQVIWRGLAAVR